MLCIASESTGDSLVCLTVDLSLIELLDRSKKFMDLFTELFFPFFIHHNCILACPFL